MRNLKAQLDAVRREDEKLNREWRPAMRENGEGLQGFVDRRAVMNAIRTEGPEIMTADGAGYWADMRRMYPHLRGVGGSGDRGNSRSGRNNRFGRVSQRMIRGVWWVRIKGEWVRA